MDWRRMRDCTELGGRALQIAKEMTLRFALTEQRIRLIFVSLGGWKYGYLTSILYSPFPTSAEDPVGAI
jgi:hypothetical protein